MAQSTRHKLLSRVKFTAFVGLLLVVYVLIDFTFNQAERVTYQFVLQGLELNKPVLLKSDTLLILIVQYDEETIKSLTSSDSDSSNHYKSRVDKSRYLVAMGYGTDSGCPLQIIEDGFKESCSKARYDLLGRSSEIQRYPDLEIPQYTFNRDFSLLTIN